CQRAGRVVDVGVPVENGWGVLPVLHADFGERASGLAAVLDGVRPVTVGGVVPRQPRAGAGPEDALAELAFHGDPILGALEADVDGCRAPFAEPAHVLL